MTLADERPIDLMGPSFERDLDVLSHVGVALPREQESLLYDVSTGEQMFGTSGYALVAWPLADPRSGDTMICLDRQTEQLRPVVIPAPLHMDHIYWSAPTDGPEARFPSLYGQVLLPSAWGRMAGDAVLLDPEPKRLWDCWPLTEGDENTLFYALMALMQADGPYAWMTALARFDAGLDEPCELVPEAYGRHHHEYVGSEPLGDFECRSAQEVADFYREACYSGRDDDYGDAIPWAFEPEVRLPYPLCENWEQLQQSGRRNSVRAIDSFPAHLREDILETERSYSPWL